MIIYSWDKRKMIISDFLIIPFHQWLTFVLLTNEKGGDSWQSETNSSLEEAGCGSAPALLTPFHHQSHYRWGTQKSVPVCKMEDVGLTQQWAPFQLESMSDFLVIEPPRGLYTILSALITSLPLTVEQPPGRSVRCPPPGARSALFTHRRVLAIGV